jgi:phenylacetate-CoA ligase
MHPALVRHIVLPLVLRRTWPPLRRRWRELERSQWLSPEEVEAARLAQLRHLVALAREKSPFHRERLRHVDPASLRGREDLARLPVLEKRDVQEHSERILLEDEDRSRLTRSATGGTTGEPTRYYWDDRYWIRSSAASFRAAKMAGFQPGDRHVMIWGTAFGEDEKSRRRQIRQEARQNKLTVPGFELGPDSLPGWMERAAAWQPRLVEGYTSLLVLAAQWILDHGFEGLRPRSVISSAEKLHDHQRRLIEAAFRAPVFDRYGSREVGCIASECDHHRGLHISAEHVIVETLRGEEATAPGESGDVVVTCLSNEVFPFLRYRIGDVATLAEEPCPCGRGLPLMHMSQGRTHDLLTTGRGTYLPGEFFPHLFKDHEGVQAFQVHQHQDRDVTIRIIRTPAWAPEQEAIYKREVHEALGEGIAVRYEYVEEIPRTKAGKLRFTISEVPVDLARHEIEPLAPGGGEDSDE